MNMLLASPMLADFSVGGSGFTHTLFVVFLAILIGLILWGMGRYFFPKFNMPPKGMLVWDGLFVLIACIVVINFLAGLMGHPLFAW